MTRLLGRARLRREDAGFTLIELLVTIVIAGIIGTILLSLITSSKTSVDKTDQQFTLTADAQTALNRIAGDLQQAVALTPVGGGTVIPAITAVANPDGPSFDAHAVTSFTFNLDASGDGCVAGVASENLSSAASASPSPCPGTAPPASDPNPETETVCWDPTAQQLYLIATDPANETTPVTSCASGQPLLAGRVTSFEAFYRSSLYRYQDHSGVDPNPGVTTWYDLDTAGPPVGNDNGKLDMPELQFISLVTLQMTLSEGNSTQTFTTQVDLRNVHPDA